MELEIRMCSIRNAPTGIMPLRECSRRSRKLIPFPVRSGATPDFTSSGLPKLPASPTAGTLAATENLLRLLARRLQMKNGELLIIFWGVGEVKEGATTRAQRVGAFSPTKHLLVRCRRSLHYLARQGIDILAASPQNVHTMMTVQDGSVGPSLQAVRLTWQQGVPQHIARLLFKGSQFASV